MGGFLALSRLIANARVGLLIKRELPCGQKHPARCQALRRTVNMNISHLPWLPGPRAKQESRRPFWVFDCEAEPLCSGRKHCAEVALYASGEQRHYVNYGTSPACPGIFHFLAARQNLRRWQDASYALDIRQHLDNSDQSHVRTMTQRNQ